jgi:hypothetical protein
MGWLRSAAAAACAVGLAGCTHLYTQPQLARTVGEDTVGYSLAYARAANNQILLNILQARDRLPRHYLTVSGIADAPSTFNQAKMNLGPLPFGNPALPFGASSVEGITSQQIRPSYGVTPLNPDRLLKAIYAPMPEDVFEFYWSNAWPRDVLLLLFTRSLRAGSCDNLTGPEILRAGQLAIGAAGARGGCAFVEDRAGADLGRLAVMATARGEAGSVELVPLRQGGCRTLMEASTPAERVELLKLSVADKAYRYSEDARSGTARLESCGEFKTAALVFPGEDGRERIYVLELRSLDQITYWLGGRVREGGMPMVRPPGWRAGPGEVPLFQVVEGPPPGGLGDDDFAAAMTYRGKRYRAGYAVECDPGQCRPEVAPIADRSSTVLAMLAQLYALAPAPESLTPPGRFIVE